jgi:hypothetical protein
MIASALIIGFSFILLVYWFRYSCMLLLRGGSGESPAAYRRFDYSEILGRLESETALDPLHRALDRDYRVLTYLLQHAAGLDGGLEDRLLVLDYRLMRFCYRLTRSAAPRQARAALSEMASVLAVLDRKIGVPPAPAA